MPDRHIAHATEKPTDASLAAHVVAGRSSTARRTRPSPRCRSGAPGVLTSSMMRTAPPVQRSGHTRPGVPDA